MNYVKRGIKVIEYKILDSSIWIAYLFEGHFKKEIESNEQLFLSVLSLFEIKTKLLKKKINKKEVNDKVDFIKKRCVILPINEKVAEMASELSAEKNLPAIDSLIYSTSQINNLKLITLDNDLRGLDNVEVFGI